MKRHLKNNTKTILGLLTLIPIIITMTTNAYAEESEFNNGDVTAPELPPYQNGLLDNTNDFGGHGDNGVYGPNVDEANGIHITPIKTTFEPTGVTCEMQEHGTVLICAIYGLEIETIEFPTTTVEEFGELNGGEETPKPPIVPPDLQPQEPKSFEERTLEQLQAMEDEGIILSSTQMELKLILESNRDVCDFGTEHGKNIQDESYHELPTDIVDIAKNPDYSTNVLIGKYKKLNQACTEWDNNKASILGPEYLTRQEHAQQAVEEALERVAYLESLTHQYDSLSVNDYQETIEDAESELCDSNLYSAHTKSTYDYCDVEVTLGENRGGYVDTSTNPIVQQYLESKETGINIVNPDLTPETYISPMDNARSYMKVYGYIPVEVAQQLTAEQLTELLEEIKITQGEAS
jgi:hypothetical protein